jgi:hypothetical protein
MHHHYTNPPSRRDKTSRVELGQEQKKGLGISQTPLSLSLSLVAVTSSKATTYPNEYDIPARLYAYQPAYLHSLPAYPSAIRTR